MNYQINNNTQRGIFPTLEKSLRSTVKLWTDPKTKKQYAIKFVSAENGSLQKEYDLLGKFCHPNIIQALENGTEGKNNYLITEFMNEGDLLKFAINNSKLYMPLFRKGKSFEKFWRSIFLQCLNALLYLHNLGWAHLDLKPENFLINSEFDIKLIDFEFCFQMDTLTSNKLQCSKSCGSESYYSPEIKESLTPYDPMKSDVFSLAVMMMTLMRGINLFTANVGNSNFQYCQIKCGEFKGFWNKLSFAEVFSVEFKDLMEKMLTYDPTNRISLEEVKNHKWFRGETFNKDELKEFFNKFEVYLLKESGSKKNSKYESFPKKVKKDQN